MQIFPKGFGCHSASDRQVVGDLQTVAAQAEAAQLEAQAEAAQAEAAQPAVAALTAAAQSAARTVADVPSAADPNTAAEQTAAPAQTAAVGTLLAAVQIAAVGAVGNLREAAHARIARVQKAAAVRTAAGAQPAAIGNLLEVAQHTAVGAFGNLREAAHDAAAHETAEVEAEPKVPVCGWVVRNEAVATQTASLTAALSQMQAAEEKMVTMVEGIVAAVAEKLPPKTALHLFLVLLVLGLQLKSRFLGVYLREHLHGHAAN